MLKLGRLIGQGVPLSRVFAVAAARNGSSGPLKIFCQSASKFWDRYFVLSKEFTD
jgi:hypothetical protein